MTRQTTRDLNRDRIARETEQFLADGGHIQHPTSFDNAAYKRPVKLKRKDHLERERVRFQVRKPR